MASRVPGLPRLGKAKNAGGPGIPEPPHVSACYCCRPSFASWAEGAWRAVGLRLDLGSPGLQVRTVRRAVRRAARWTGRVVAAARSLGCLGTGRSRAGAVRWAGLAASGRAGGIEAAIHRLRAGAGVGPRQPCPHTANRREREHGHAQHPRSSRHQATSFRRGTSIQRQTAYFPFNAGRAVRSFASSTRHKPWSSSVITQGSITR